MYAYITTTSDNGKDIIFGVSYNDVMFELETIEIDGSFYNLDAHHEDRRTDLYTYMVSTINVWPLIRKYVKNIMDELYIENNRD